MSQTGAELTGARLVGVNYSEGSFASSMVSLGYDE
jgi:hypothetical protein